MAVTETYGAEVLADSMSPDGIRLTTMWVTFPRFILAEVNTHRMLSRNSNSSRAIPPERQIAKVRENPFVPETFNKRVKGMGVGEALTGADAEVARETWIGASLQACKAAGFLLELDCDKSRINRLLEPFLWHSAVISATEWDNFFALRDHPAAQPEFHIVAKLMRKAMEDSEPVDLGYGQWHLPGVTDEDRQVCGTEALKKVSAGRLARWTSYNLKTEDAVAAACERADRLISSFHMSPTEHQARPFTKDEWDAVRYLQDEETWRAGMYQEEVRPGALLEMEFCGNYRGWVQFRKEIPNEHNAALANNLQ